MDEDIKEERSADEAGKDGNDVAVEVDDLWFKYMEAKLASKSKHCQRSHLFTICKVPRDIREVDSVAYDPLVVSIGPYHRGNPNLHDMEEVKWRNLNEFRRRPGINFNEYLKAMKEIEPRARDCYSGNIDMEADEFIEMMLLDGLFMIELFSKSGNFLPSILLRLFNFGKTEPIYTIRGTLCRVGHDMLLLENQLPLFVLERLWKLTDGRSRYNSWKSACIFICRFAMRFDQEWDFSILREIFDQKNKTKNPEIIDADGVHHLLHLVHLCFLKSKPMESEPTTGCSKFIEKMKTLSFPPPKCRDCFPSPQECTAKFTEVIKKMKIRGLSFQSSSSESKREPPPLTVIPSATELEEAGVKFECVGAKSFLDIKFEQGTMKMPRLSVQDSTKSLLRNFIAYEQCFPEQGDHITSYCSFMDDLVNTRRDVEILKKSLIIENRLGSDKAVALLFNDLGKGIFVSGFKNSYLAGSFIEVTKHTQKTWPKWQAKLNHDYFSNPWAIISVIAATFVILLTMVQTYFAVFT